MSFSKREFPNAKFQTMVGQRRHYMLQNGFSSNFSNTCSQEDLNSVLSRDGIRSLGPICHEQTLFQRFLEGVFLVVGLLSSRLHFGQTYLSGTLFFLILPQAMCTQMLHWSHSIIGRPANGPPQKQVTEYQDASSKIFINNIH